MPKTHRQQIQRKLAQSYINTNWAASYIKDVYDEYLPVHPEQAEILLAVLESYKGICDLIEIFAKETSGHIDIDWQAWAATGRPTHGVDIESDE